MIELNLEHQIMFKNTRSRILKPNVIIIGAGVAGLSVARELYKKGMRPIILEARDRIGGRVHTTTQWGAATDLGASWIHKTQRNPLKTIARKNNLLTYSTVYSSSYPFAKFNSSTVYDPNGKQIPKNKIKEALKQIQDFSNYLKAHLLLHDENYSAADALEEYAKKYPLSTESRNLLRFISAEIGEYETGANLSNISIKTAQQIDPITTGSDDIFVYGYSQLLAQLAKQIPILLNQNVIKISYNSKCVNVFTSKHQYTAPYIVVTVPIGVLKSEKMKFEPPLPKEKINAIKRMGVGVFNKIYLLFDKPFWEINSEWLVLMPRKNFPDESYEILNFYKLTKQPILLVFTSGSFSSKLEKLSDEQILNHIMQRLKTVYGENVSYPSSFLITRWGTDPFSLGSFSYPRVGVTVRDYKLLAQQVESKIFFAGEATSWTDPSTVAGAYISGVKAAREIVALNNRSKLIRISKPNR